MQNIRDKGWVGKHETRCFYDTTASSYDSLYQKEQYDKYELVLPRVKTIPNLKILDAGCGTCLFEEYLMSKSVDDYYAFAVDISTGLLSKAKRKLQLRKNTFLICADTDFLPFISGIFDLCVAFTLLQNLPNPVITLRELKRVSGEKASLIVTFLKKVGITDFEMLLKKVGLKGEFLQNTHVNEQIALYSSGSN